MAADRGNEAFAAVALAVAQELGLPQDIKAKPSLTVIRSARQERC